MAVRSLVFILIVGLAGLYVRTLASSPVRSGGIPDFQSLPRQMEGWSSEDIPVAESVARVLGADAMLNRVYSDGRGHYVSVFLAYFASQQVNSQIHSPRNCLPGSGWDILSTDRVVESIGGQTCSATRMTIARNADRNEMLYWFRTRGGDVTGEYGLKWDLMKNGLARRPTDAAFIRFVAPVDQKAALREVMARLNGPLRRTLGQVGL